MKIILNTVEEKIRFLEKAVEKLNGLDQKLHFTEDTDLLTEAGLDSLGIIELQLYIEDCTGLTIKDPTFTITTVRDILKLIE